MINRVNIKNYKSIKDTWIIEFSDIMFVLAGQNESWKSSILESLESYENDLFDKDTLNFEEEERWNLEQEVLCVYSTEDMQDYFINDLVEKLKEDFKITEEDFIDKEKLEKIKEYSITKKFNHTDKILSISLNEPILNIIKSAIKFEEVKEVSWNVGEEEKVIINKKYYIDVDSNHDKIANAFFHISPKIILFNDFSTLLPDKFLISDLENDKADWYRAVKNIEKLMDHSFKTIHNLSSNALRRSSTSRENDSISVNFQKDWKQKIHWNNNVKITFNIDNEDINWQVAPTIFFYVETKDNVLLEPRKRSKGMIWFLSAWLDLKAKLDNRSLVILYDEPGLYLHIKAHSDILWVFKSLNEKWHQIIYSTHSPSLIDTKKLSNIWLVLNTEKSWTIVEWLTTSKINSIDKRDALQPVAEAMWLEPLKDFSILYNKNVILEWLSDFWYFKWMSNLLDIKNNDYELIPWIWIKWNNIYHLISFCLWYGLDWILVMDNWVIPKQTKDDLKDSIFNGDENKTNEKIKLINHDEIENMFSINDLHLIDDTVKITDKRKSIDVIWKWRKILFSKIFFEKVNSWKITKKQLDKKTITNFEEVFSFIDKMFK